MDKREQMSESFRLGVLLAITGGFLDAYSYVARGKVFATAETGNMVLMGLNIAQGNWQKVPHYLIPIVCYALGVLAAEQIKGRYKNNTDINMHWRQIVVLAEILVVAIAAFIPQGELDIIANSSIAFVCSMQVESFRKVNGNAYATTMCTGNLRSGMEHIHKMLFQNNRASRKAALEYFGIIASFIFGAMVGVWTSDRWQGRAALVCCGFLVAVFAIMFVREEETQEEKREEAKKYQ